MTASTSTPLLPDPEAAASAWLTRRWGRAVADVQGAPARWQRWARSELIERDPVGCALHARHGWIARTGEVQGSWDEVRRGPERTALGQWFTPHPVADLVARVALWPQETWPSPVVLDPAAGGGSLLLAVARARRRMGWPVLRVLASLEGWDRDPVAAWTCRAALVCWALEEGCDGPAPASPLRIHGGIDALDDDGLPGTLLARRGPYPDGVGAVVTNPPYLESKRMNRAEPGLKDRLRRRFPQLHGAFDLYLAFCHRALEQVGEGGSAVLLVPNKITQGRYASRFREEILGAGEPVLADLVDLSAARPRPFPGTGVYPVVLHLRRRAAPQTFRVHRVREPDDLDRPRDEWGEVDAEEMRAVGGECPLFVPFPQTWRGLAPLLRLGRLGDVATLVTTCSFHKKGLREQFVTPERPDAHAQPYLGGPSRTRRTEVDCFRVRWRGWWIRFDQQALRHEHRNPLPPLAETFLRPKILFCQHGRRLRPVADPEGRWVSKDVYPVAWPAPGSGYDLWRLLAVLASTPFTALYNTLYQGIVCGGETLHYLPAFLKTVPVPPADAPALVQAGRIARELSESDGEVDRSRWAALDRAVCRAYDLDEATRVALVRTHLERVGAAAPATGAP